MPRRFAAVVKSYARLVKFKRKMRLIERSDLPIVIGPWFSEVGFELLYWIPFLNWFQNEYKIESNRFIVVSRGGAELWYKHIGGRYLDVFDFFSEGEFRQRNQARIETNQIQKQLTISDFDQDVYNLSKQTLGIDEAIWFHPLIMYNLFGMYWWQKQPIRHIEEHSFYQPLDKPNKKLPVLPEKYAAFKIYFRDSFPNSQRNRELVRDIIKNLSEDMYVVLLDTSLEIDDHRDMLIPKNDRVISIREHITPRNNLAVQTLALSGANLFVGTYGGFSYLAPFYGVPSISFYSDVSGFIPSHLDVARRIFTALNASYVVLSTEDVGKLRQILR